MARHPGLDPGFRVVVKLALAIDALDAESESA